MRHASAVTSNATQLSQGPSEDDVDDAAQPDPLVPRHGRHSRGAIYGTMMASAIICLIASAVLSVEGYHLALNPNATLGCDLNEAVSCGAVAQAWQAQVFGFPNAFIGLATEPVVLTIAVACLAGTRFPRWFMFCAQIGYSLGLIFALWLFTQSVWSIGALCPWCMLITVFTTVTFFTMLHANILDDNLYLSRRAQSKALAFVRIDGDVVVPGIMLAIIAIIVVWNYGLALLA